MMNGLVEIVLHIEYFERVRIDDSFFAPFGLDVATLHERRVTADVVLQHLRRDEEAAAARLEQLRHELEVISAQVVDQSDKCAALASQEGDAEQQVQLIERTLTPLQREREKARLLLQNFLPPHADVSVYED